VGDTENVNENVVKGQIVSISGANLDLTVNFELGIPQSSIIKSTETYTFDGNLWNIKYETPGNCLGEHGPCDPILSYQTIISNRLFTFTLRGTYPNRIVPQQILSTFKFLD